MDTRSPDEWQVSPPTVGSSEEKINEWEKKRAEKYISYDLKELKISGEDPVTGLS